MNSNQEKTKIQGFIKSISEKNYAQANKYLKDVLDCKFGQKIHQNKNKPLFK